MAAVYSCGTTNGAITSWSSGVDWSTGTSSSSTAVISSTGVTWVGSCEATTATTGSIYFDSTDSVIRVFSDNTWIDLSNVAVSTNTYIVKGNGSLISIVNKEETLKNTIKSIIKSNLLIKKDVRQRALANKISEQEIKARMTLRDQISERDWRRYLTNGFVLIKGISGRYYQVFNDQRHIKVYNKGKLTDEICIHTDASECPPTDHILNMMLLIQNDENLIWTKGIGNVYKKDNNSLSGNIISSNISFCSGEDWYDKSVSLSEKYKRLKVA